MSISKRNRRGVAGLIILCLLIAITPRILTATYSIEKPIVSFSEVKKLHLEVKQKKAKAKKSKKSSWKSRFRKPNSKFDPKYYRVNDWMKLGLSEKQSEVVVKFASRGISGESELKKIFVIPDELFLLIKDSVIYSVEGTSKINNSSSKKEIELVDLNTCSREQLIKLPGIGEYFADKIISYREILGGYNSKSQLLEVWNFNIEKLDKISPYLIFSNEINKINVNSATLDELKQHPYITYNVANSIVKMRSQSKFSELSDIKRSKLIDEELYKKIEPYLECK